MFYGICHCKLNKFHSLMLFFTLKFLKILLHDYECNLFKFAWLLFQYISNLFWVVIFQEVDLTYTQTTMKHLCIYALIDKT